jgi:hypothetical protein
MDFMHILRNFFYGHHFQAVIFSTSKQENIKVVCPVGEKKSIHKKLLASVPKFLVAVIEHLRP